MSEPIVQANESLVRNGDFEEGFSHWKKAQGNGWLGTASEPDSDGFQIRFLKAGNGASVSQALTVPKDPGAEARYVLSFQCETRHTEAGKLVVSIEGQSEELVIPLLPGKPRDPAEDLARLNDGQPLIYKPIPYEVHLDLPFNGQDTITVSVFSPPNVLGDILSQVCITRIKLLLELDPAKMQMLKLDEQSLPATGLLYLCLGASASEAHRLEFVPEADNAWVGTQAALTSGDNPLGAVVATPDWGVDQPLERSWTLDCPLIGDQGSYLFWINLVNQYTAEPYPVQVSLGHHRVVFREVDEAPYYPVLGQSVRLRVRVASYYTGGYLSGWPVKWTVTGQQVSKVAVTDEDGWSSFDFDATQAGKFDVEASAESPYYATGVVTEMLEVRVLATSPWEDVLEVVEGIEEPWAKKIGYPNRGSDYLVKVKLPADSPLLETNMSLRWSGDSQEQLGVVSLPKIGADVPVTGQEIAWKLTSEDRMDGRFNLQLFCSKLLMPSPKKTMSLARNLVKVGEVREANKFPVVDENESVLLRVQVVHVTVSGDGDPVVNALVEWKTAEGPISTVTTGAGGWASVLYTPKNAGDHVVTASIKAHTEAVAVEQPFNVKAIATSPWKSEVRILLDGVEVDRNTLGVLCRRGQTHTLKVVPVSDSSWIGKNISLHWRKGVDPTIGLIPSDLGIPKPLVAAGVEWELVSQVDTSISRLFELELRLEGVSTVRELSGRLVSVDLTEEVSLRLDQIPAALDAKAFHPCLGARHRFSVLLNALSPLVGLESWLTWLGTSAEELEATVEPALDLAQPINDGGANWMLDFTASQQPGLFSLIWEIPLLGFVAIAKPMTLGHNKVRIETWRESPVDPVVGQDPAWLWVQVFSHFTGLAVDQVPVKWTALGSSVKPTDAEGWSGFAVAPASAGPHGVKAVVISPYDGYEEERSMKVTALASNPWAKLMVSFDGASAQPWGEKTYFPRRKGGHMLKLWAPADSPLLNRELKLGMTGSGPDELGIRFLSEALGVPRMFHEVGMEYSFKVDDLKDGSFGLCLASERLASLSSVNAMSVGEGSRVMKITWDHSVSQTLDWGRELVEQVTVRSTTSGKAMAGVPVTWRSPDLGVVKTLTNFYGVAKVRFIPKTPGTAELTATVGEGINAQMISLPFEMNEPREIYSLTSPNPSGHLGELVSADITVVSARNGEPLQNVRVSWTYPSISLAPTTTDAQGKSQVSFRLPGVARGLLEATVEGGYAGWELKHIEFKLVPTVSTLSAPANTHQL